MATVNSGQYEQAMLTGGNKKAHFYPSVFNESVPTTKRELMYSHEKGEHWCDTVFFSKEDFERLHSDQKGIGKKYPTHPVHEVDLGR
jgi:hypothetical protein